MDREDFPHNSVGKESACNAGDPSSIPGSGGSAGEEILYPLQYSWDSLVAQMIKNPPGKRETCDTSLGWEDPHHSSNLIGYFHGLYSPWGFKESDTTE